MCFVLFCFHIREICVLLCSILHSRVVFCVHPEWGLNCNGDYWDNAVTQRAPDGLRFSLRVCGAGQSVKPKPIPAF